MKFGIIAAMPQEIATLLESVTDKKENQVLGTLYYTGTLGHHEVILVQSGIGKVMSAVSVAILAEVFKVDSIINTGSAGAVAEGLAIGDLVLAEKLVYHDVDVTAFGYEYGQMAGQKRYYSTDSTLLEYLEKTLEKQSHPYHLGLIATGDSFIAGEDKIASIKSYFPNVLAVEMEGAAIAQAAHQAQKPCLVIRAISDTADHQAHLSFDEFIIEAGRRSANTLLTFLESLPEKLD